jgi:hypothetical protein
MLVDLGTIVTVSTGYTKNIDTQWRFEGDIYGQKFQKYNSHQ